MAGLTEPVARHWSQLVAGDVVRVADGVWMQVSSVGHRGERLVLSGLELDGFRRGRRVSRRLPKDRLFIVDDSRRGAPCLVWRRRGPGHWSAPGYDLRRDRPRADWQILRDGEHWGAARSLHWAQRMCEGDAVRRSDASAGNTSTIDDVSPPGG